MSSDRPKNKFNVGRRVYFSDPTKEIVDILIGTVVAVSWSYPYIYRVVADKYLDGSKILDSSGPFNIKEFDVKEERLFYKKEDILDWCIGYAKLSVSYWTDIIKTLKIKREGVKLDNDVEE